MRYFYLFVISVFFVVSASGNPAQARQSHSLMSWIFTPEEDEHDRPYMNKGENAYDSDWEYSWTPASWADSATSAQGVVDGFYSSGVLIDQYIDDDTPVLEVGQRFLELSGRDQRRVVRFVAHVFNIDGLTGSGAMNILLRRKHECVTLGVYSSGQVQLH